MASERVDCVVIGAGIIGLAIARALVAQGRGVLVLESQPHIGSEISSRNSSVIHAGIYYPKNSLKAELCRLGRDALYAYVKDRGVGYQQCGKLIVATSDSQRAKLEQIQLTARANQVDDLTPLSKEDISRLEPDIEAIFGLMSPLTGIVDVHELMLAYQGDIEAGDGMIVVNAPVQAGKILSDGIGLEIGGSDPMTLHANTVINATGLHAQDMARTLQGFPEAHIPQRFLAIGHYYVLNGPHRFRHLVYPVPEDGGLGVHMTLDLGGQARFGPDVRWIDEIDYRFNDSERARFIDSIHDYYPRLDPERLTPGYTGIRPKIIGVGGGFADFRIDGPAQHGVSGLINLFGIESPGLTASLAIADHVAGLI